MGIEHNLKLQELYDKNVNAATKESISIKKFDAFGDDSLFLVSGQNAYFNKHIEDNGLNNIGVDAIDNELLRQLFLLVKEYGQPHNYAQNGSILYTAAPGTYELNYARQSFPAGIIEDIFHWQNYKNPLPWYTIWCNQDKFLTIPVKLIIGEPEYDYWMRVILEMIKIKRKNGESLEIDGRILTEEEIEQFLMKIRELFKKFCTGVNRLYFINIMQILDNLFDYGIRVEKIRTGSVSKEEKDKIFPELKTMKQGINDIVPDIEGPVEKAKKFISLQKNGHNQYGLAIIGEITGPISYVNIKTTYALLQEYFLSMGYKDGDTIDNKYIYELFKDQSQLQSERNEKLI